jgi:hypothetical protein
MWLPASLLARTFANPCFGHERKVSVAIVIYVIDLMQKKML